MKKLIQTLVALSFLIGTISTALAGMAAVPNDFISTDGDSNIVQLVNKDDMTFGVFDYMGDPKNGVDLVNNSMTVASFSVNENNGSYELVVNYGAASGSVSLGDSGDFSFYFKDSNGNYYDVLEITQIAPGTNSYHIKFADNEVIGVDLNVPTNPVPVPGASVLLLSGLVGLVAMGTRRNK